jgi:hypothetical protein
VSSSVEISVLAAPIEDTALDQLASVLVDCVEGGASVSFMAPFSQDDGLAFFRKVAASVASGDTVLLAAKLDGKIIGTVQLGLDTPPNQPHRGYQKCWCTVSRGQGVGTALMARRRRSAAWRWLLVLDTLRQTATASTGAPAGPNAAPSRTARFRMAGCATPRCSGSGWIDSRIKKL